MSIEHSSAAREANAVYVLKHGHEDPDYLGELLKAAHRQVAAAQQVAADLYVRYQAATKAEWDGIYDAQIMESEHLRRRLVQFAAREDWASGRLQRLGPKCPLGRLALHDEGGKGENWLPTFEAFTLERTFTEAQRAEAAEAIRELGRLWAFGRRLIKISFMCPDLGEIGWRCWIEYEPATEQGRVMVKDSRYADAKQLVYGPVTELVSAAIEHVDLLKGMWSSYE